MPKWSYILNLKKDPSTTITPQTRGKGGNKGGGWNGRKNKGRREIQLLVPLPCPCFTLIDLLRFGESTYIASHLPSRIWVHIGNRTRDFSQRRPGTKQLPKILASWLFSSLGKKFLNQLKEDGRKREKRKKISFFLCLSYFVLTLAEVVALHTRANTRENFCEKRAGQRRRWSLLLFLPLLLPQITQVLAYLHLVFPTSPLSVSLKQTTGTQARLTLESKAFYHLRPPLFILSLVGWWQTNGAYPRSDLFEGTCLLRMKN